jgi:ABC-type phosphate/phosphonate transport system substrate-binding protein
LCLAAAAGAAWAAPSETSADSAITLAVNVGVSSGQTDLDVRERFRPLSELLKNAVGRDVRVSGVLSHHVQERMRQGTFDALIIHTHAALEAARGRDYAVLAFTEELDDNRVLFVAKRSLPVKDPAALAAYRVAVPGGQTFAGAAARAALIDIGLTPSTMRLIPMKYQDAASHYLEVGFADVVVVRSSRIAKEFVEKHAGRIVLEGKPGPVYAVIAKRDLKEALRKKLREALSGAHAQEQVSKLLRSLKITRFVEATPGELDKASAWLRMPAAVAQR